VFAGLGGLVDVVGDVEKTLLEPGWCLKNASPAALR
jgi:hypothetical protein